MRARVGRAVVLVALAVGAGRAEVRLPQIFGSHMVLQREKPIPVWGWAAPGEAVSVQLGEHPLVETQADESGHWRVDLPPVPAGGPVTLTVRGPNEIRLEDVLIGEVWIGSGQSNMQMTVGGCLNADQEAAAANYPQIRHVCVARITAPLQADDVKLERPWEVCSPEVVKAWSAACYFMGRELHQELGVPIGLINTSWGGTLIEPWTPPEGFARVPSLAAIHRRVRLADPRTDEHKEALGQYLNDLLIWADAARDALASGTYVDPSPAWPTGLNPLTVSSAPQQQPTALYNAMVAGLVPFAFRGAIWYQGESNHRDGMLYTDKMRALIEGWRLLWGEDFPFYFVQIAPYRYGDEPAHYLGEFWEAQAAVTTTVPNTGMVGTNDIGELDDIHPRNKQAVGHRLALLALAKTYGRNVVCSGPTFKALELEGSRLRVRLDNLGGGLTTRDGQAPNWFSIIGEQTPWVEAEATIDGDSVVLSSPRVPTPLAVRFAWSKLAEPNLMNREGLPAVPFRAGDVPVNDLLLMNVDEAKDYQLVYDLDLAKLGAEIPYDVDNRARVLGPIDRVAYFLELQKEGQETQWVYVSMDAFTTDLSKIGIPTVASKAMFQTLVSHLTVLSNVPGIVTGTDLKGNLEFWPHNYGPPNSANVPNASGALWDFGDQPSAPEDGYGSMQVGNYEAKQTIFAINQWKAGANADLGIGNSEGQTRDWTFAHNASQYVVKRLRVLVCVK